MINSKKELKEILQYEKSLYWGAEDGKYQYLLAFFKSHPNYAVWKYLKALRVAGYYGAIVVSSFRELGITIGGVPARRLK